MNGAKKVCGGTYDNTLCFFHLNWKINWHTFVAQEIFINDKWQNKLTFLYLHLLRLCSIFYWSWKCIDNIRMHFFPASNNVLGSARIKFLHPWIYWWHYQNAHLEKALKKLFCSLNCLLNFRGMRNEVRFTFRVVSSEKITSNCVFDTSVANFPFTSKDRNASALKTF